MTGCSHKTCQCQIAGCGLDHPKNWTPTVKMCINGVDVGGDDVADCLAHYLLQCGYPTDQPEHLRNIAVAVAERHGR